METGGKDPNDFGLYDMLGNAVEWVSDCYHETYDLAPTDGSSWDEAACAYRITRGGCYGSNPGSLRVSAREGVEPNFYGACAPGVRGPASAPPAPRRPAPPTGSRSRAARSGWAARRATTTATPTSCPRTPSPWRPST